MPGAFASHVIELLLELLRVVGLDELFVHLFYASEQVGGLIDFAEGDLKVVVVDVFFFVVGEHGGQFFYVGFGQDVGAEAFEFVDAGFEGASQLLDVPVFVPDADGAFELDVGGAVLALAFDANHCGI
jgi:hypothetical protein